ncbi:MAG TPA: DUF72 domain-containing protein [Candidatus Eisenbacteria bacterium]|nr:DUF72 domain-containing protein [Candidatus Eisenbacteria bacterium]
MARSAIAKLPRIVVGTSGFSYPSWRGTFYPADLAAGDMLRFYTGSFQTVEINHSFYRLPTATLLASWRRQTPPAFRFALKAPQRITHQLRLREAEEITTRFVTLAQTLGEQCGPLLFQLPPHLRADTPRLADFLAVLPPRTEAAFEFRHPSWFVDEIYETLAQHRAALCVADADGLTTPLIATAPFGYLRLRRDDYTDAALADWARRIREITRWKRAYVYLKHDEAGRAPALAQVLLRALA